MTIIKKNYKWNSALQNRSRTNYIVLHHAASVNCSADDIHHIHQKSNGWSGIGYHFYVRKDGMIYEGRPVGKIGAHCIGKNEQSIGVCFEGHFEIEKMPNAQVEAGKRLIAYLKDIYKDAEVKKHSDFIATACPGQYFPFDTISCETALQSIKVLESVNDIVRELSYRNIMTNSDLWLLKCENDNDAYWLARKAANMTLNSEIQLNLASVNDIVWELNQRNIITDTTLWLEKLNIDRDLYWLAYKIANLTRNK